MVQNVCLACMESAIRPHHVVCRACYESHVEVILAIKESPLEPSEIRKKLWGQRYKKNRTSANRTRIAYAAYLLAAQGDEELLVEVRQDLSKLPIAGLESAESVQNRNPTKEIITPVNNHLETEAREITFLESKLREGRSLVRQGPGGIRTMDGHFVRSKSERDIANFLFQNKIRFQYERPTWVGDVALCPDFFLPDVGDNGLFLEHFGLLENDDYRALAARKAQLFEQAGRLWIATDENDARDMDAALRMKLGRYIPSLG